MGIAALHPSGLLRTTDVVVIKTSEASSNAEAVIPGSMLRIAPE
jgi:hypothetical protein